MAHEYNVGPATIKRDGQFATAVDTLEHEVRPDIRPAVLRPAEPAVIVPPKKQVAAAGKLIQTRQVEPLPFMQRDGWKPYQVLEAIELLGPLPREEHGSINTLLDQAFLPSGDGLQILRNLRGLTTAQRQRIYALARPRMAASASGLLGSPPGGLAACVALWTRWRAWRAGAEGPRLTPGASVGVTAR